MSNSRIKALGGGCSLVYGDAKVLSSQSQPHPSAFFYLFCGNKYAQTALFTTTQEVACRKNSGIKL